MELKVIRFSRESGSTQGLLLINDQFACYTLEDEMHAQKIAGKTCIPAGRYRMALRTEGGQSQHYAQKFPRMHKGMLHVTSVPGFEYIHIHIGNTAKDTDGCLLLGDQVNNNMQGEGKVIHSTIAYKRIYPIIASAIENDEAVWIEYVDLANIGDKPETPKLIAQVSADRLNLRVAPHKEIAAVIKQGTSTSIIEQENGWDKVQIEGWVASEYMKRG
ncbi:DUF5675 family protein [Ancylomarina longa]|uniref:SH3 domain-containing protein n=1 Tax=Ancylomarina longa TaxID=2487017 RepID=A0A434AWZ3_9BACT|nr:DUF5675 family protein [Ancylomarina longa]RUT79033.1 SH3 domain-containing protein [Ancylomarina longa]